MVLNSLSWYLSCFLEHRIFWDVVFSRAVNFLRSQFFWNVKFSEQSIFLERHNFWEDQFCRACQKIRVPQKSGSIKNQTPFQLYSIIFYKYITQKVKKKIYQLPKNARQKKTKILLLKKVETKKYRPTKKIDINKILDKK